MSKDGSFYLSKGSQGPIGPPAEQLAGIWYLLLKNGKCVNYKSGYDIFKTGDLVRNVYILLSGHAILIKNESVLDILEAGQSVGAALVSPHGPSRSYPLSCKTIDECEFLQISCGRILELVKNEPTVSDYFRAQFQSRMLEIQSSHAIQNWPVASRIASFLLKKRKILEKTAITKKIIAQAVNTTTATAIRVLAELKKRNVITYEKKRIFILQQDELIKMVNSNL